MVLITSSQRQRLLFLNYVQRVSPGELEEARAELEAALAGLPHGLRLLADLSQVEFMDPACVAELGRAMDLFDQHGVSLIVRVIPDPTKDIGLSILTVFHYSHRPRVINCQSLAEALHQLSIWP
ncbi:MAG: hypothetical protein ABSH48_00190 [Verrucomicrobiota bacterium]|jgi:anti-anti-sigma regulatory factor